MFAGVYGGLHLTSCEMLIDCDNFINTVWCNILKNKIGINRFLVLVYSSHKQFRDIVVGVVTD